MSRMLPGRLVALSLLVTVGFPAFIPALQFSLLDSDLSSAPIQSSSLYSGMNGRHNEGRIVKIAVSLPATLLSTVDEARARLGLARSEYFRRAIRSTLEREREKADVERYLASYRNVPESEAETQATHAAASVILASEPWD